MKKSELIIQRDNLLLALQDLYNSSGRVANIAYNIGQKNEQWADSIYPSIKVLDKARSKAADALTGAIEKI